MAHFAVSAVGRDRPGIVAGLTEGLLELGGNVEDSQMSILRGHFAVMLIVSAPEEIDREALEGTLRPIGNRLELEALAVSEVGETDPAAGHPTHVITVYGADHPGIVHGVSAALAEREVNITDLQTRLTGEPGSSLYVMMLEVELGDRASELERELADVAERADVEVSITELDDQAL